MNIFKNKLFIWIIVSIFLIFIFQIFIVSSSFSRDTNSYILLIKWDWTITREGSDKIFLEIDKKELIQNWDIISIIWKDSLWVIEWWDGSLTRLSWNSRLRVDESMVSDDIWEIQISFELLKWKTWSNILTIIWDNSYFYQKTKEVTASVRWTVFEVDYDNDFIYVHNHQVDVLDSDWNKKQVYAWETFDISAKIIDELKRIRDETWEKINKNLDEEHILKMREDLKKSFRENNPFLKIKLFILSIISNEYKANYYLYTNDFDSLLTLIDSLDWEEKQKIIDILNNYNQRLNFENWEDKALYERKLNIRQTLISWVDDDSFKEVLTKYSMYDLSDIFSKANIDRDVLEKTLWFLEKNSPHINIDEDLLKAFWDNADLFRDIFNIWNIRSIDFNFDSVMNKIKDLNKLWNDFIHNNLNKLLDLYDSVK